jgi:hypothetical protein
LSFTNKTIDLGFVYLELTEHCVVATVKEGILIELDHVAEIHEVFGKYYSERNFGYIDNRIYQHAINLSPDLYKIRYSKLVCLAIVCYTESCYKNAHFEKAFYNWPFEVFKNMEEAEQWIAEWVAKEEKN